MAQLPDFHPLTVVRDWGRGEAFRVADALTGVSFFGATGSRKTSGVAKYLALSYLANDFGEIVLCAKKEERHQWEGWAKVTKRTDDLIIIDACGKWRFNFLDWEATRTGEGGGLTIIVALLDKIAGNIAGGASKEEGGGDNQFFIDALHHLNTNLIDLPLFADLQVSLPLLRSIVVTAPTSIKELEDPNWQKRSVCWAIIQEAEDKLKGADEDILEDFEECRNYWLREFPVLSDSPLLVQ